MSEKVYTQSKFARGSWKCEVCGILHEEGGKPHQNEVCARADEKWIYLKKVDMKFIKDKKKWTLEGGKVAWNAIEKMNTANIKRRNENMITFSAEAVRRHRENSAAGGAI